MKPFLARNSWEVETAARMMFNLYMRAGFMGTPRDETSWDDISQVDRDHFSERTWRYLNDLHKAEVI